MTAQPNDLVNDLFNDAQPNDAQPMTLSILCKACPAFAGSIPKITPSILHSRQAMKYTGGIAITT